MVLLIVFLNTVAFAHSEGSLSQLREATSDGGPVEAVDELARGVEKGAENLFDSLRRNVVLLPTAAKETTIPTTPTTPKKAKIKARKPAVPYTIAVPEQWLPALPAKPKVEKKVAPAKKHRTLEELFHYWPEEDKLEDKLHKLNDHTLALQKADRAEMIAERVEDKELHQAELRRWAATKAEAKAEAVEEHRDIWEKDEELADDAQGAVSEAAERMDPGETALRAHFAGVEDPRLQDASVGGFSQASDDSDTFTSTQAPLNDEVMNLEDEWTDAKLGMRDLPAPGSSFLDREHSVSRGPSSFDDPEVKGDWKRFVDATHQQHLSDIRGAKKELAWMKRLERDLPPKKLMGTHHKTRAERERENLRAIAQRVANEAEVQSAPESLVQEEDQAGSKWSWSGLGSAVKAGIFGSKPASHFVIPDVRRPAAAIEKGSPSSNEPTATATSENTKTATSENITGAGSAASAAPTESAASAESAAPVVDIAKVVELAKAQGAPPAALEAIVAEAAGAPPETAAVSLNETERDAFGAQTEHLAQQAATAAKESVRAVEGGSAPTLTTPSPEQIRARAVRAAELAVNISEAAEVSASDAVEHAKADANKARRAEDDARLMYIQADRLRFPPHLATNATREMKLEMLAKGTTARLEAAKARGLAKVAQKSATMALKSQREVARLRMETVEAAMDANGFEVTSSRRLKAMARAQKLAIAAEKYRNQTADYAHDAANAEVAAVEAYEAAKEATQHDIPDPYWPGGTEPYNDPLPDFPAQHESAPESAADPKDSMGSGGADSPTA